jgi:hypothetical protein
MTDKTFLITRWLLIVLSISLSLVLVFILEVNTAP